MKSINPIVWWRRRVAGREPRDAFGAAEEELYALLDEASKISAT